MPGFFLFSEILCRGPTTDYRLVIRARLFLAEIVQITMPPELSLVLMHKKVVCPQRMTTLHLHMCFPRVLQVF